MATGNVTVYIVFAARPPATSMRITLGIGDVAVNVTAGLNRIIASDVTSTGAVDEKVSGSTLATPVWPSENEAGPIASGSTLKLNALTSPGVQPAAISPPAGAQTWMPCLSTTSGEN